MFYMAHHEGTGSKFQNPEVFHDETNIVNELDIFLLKIPEHSILIDTF